MQGMHSDWYRVGTTQKREQFAAANLRWSLPGFFSRLRLEKLAGRWRWRGEECLKELGREEGCGCCGAAFGCAGQLERQQA